MISHFLRDDDLSPGRAGRGPGARRALKKAAASATKPLAGPQTVAVIFDKPSTRTRVSFAVGIAELGGNPLIISTANSQLGGRGDPADTARVLERQVAAIVWRTFARPARGDGRAAPGCRWSTPLRRLPPVPDPRRPADGAGAQGRPGRAHHDLPRRRRQQHGALLPARRRHRGHARADRGPADYLPRPDIVADAEAIAAATGGSVLVTTDAAEAAAPGPTCWSPTPGSRWARRRRRRRARSLQPYAVDESCMALAPRTR